MKIRNHISCYAALLLAVAMLLSACRSGNNAEPPSGTTAESGDENNLPESTQKPTNADMPKPAKPEELALEQYRTIVGQAGTYDYGNEATSAGYQYALVRMQSGDAVPTLLLKQQTTEYIDYVRVFQYEPGSGTVIQPTDTLMEGVAQAGGYRGGLAMQPDGNGIRSVTTSSGTGDTSITRVTLEGDALHYDVQWEGRMDMIPDELGPVDIVWNDVGNASALDNWPEVVNLEEPEDPAEPPRDYGTSDGEAALPADGNRIVFCGTINIYSYDEVVKLQGEPDPNSEWADTSKTFRLIKLDTPQAMNLRNGDGVGSRESEVDFINVTYAEGLEQYDGQHLIFSIDPDDTWWPSDTSLPLGRPSTGNVHILQ